MINTFGYKCTILLTAIIILSGCSAEKNSKNEIKASLSAPELYANNCTSCHGGNLQGALGPKLQDIGSRLSKQDILHILDKGRGDMRPQIYLPKEDRDKLATWLSEKNNK